MAKLLRLLMPVDDNEFLSQRTISSRSVRKFMSDCMAKEDFEALGSLGLCEIKDPWGLDLRLVAGRNEDPHPIFFILEAMRDDRRYVMIYQLFSGKIHIFDGDVDVVAYKLHCEQEFVMRYDIDLDRRPYPVQRYSRIYKVRMNWIFGGFYLKATEDCRVDLEFYYEEYDFQNGKQFVYPPMAFKASMLNSLKCRIHYCPL